MAFDVGMVVITQVKADRVEEFERWMRDVAVPAVAHGTVRGRWRLASTGSDRDGEACYVFLFEGRDPAEVDLVPVLEAEYGAERAAAEVNAFEDMLTQEQQLLILEPVAEG